MRNIWFMKRVLLVSSLALIAWLPSPPAQADEQSIGSTPSQQEEIQKETVQKETSGDRPQVQQAAPGDELGTESEQQMSIPHGIGPDPFDMEMTREQDAAASLSF